jgi:hypothetical protein
MGADKRFSRSFVWATMMFFPTISSCATSASQAHEPAGPERGAKVAQEEHDSAVQGNGRSVSALVDLEENKSKRLQLHALRSADLDTEAETYEFVVFDDGLILFAGAGCAFAPGREKRILSDQQMNSLKTLLGSGGSKSEESFPICTHSPILKVTWLSDGLSVESRDQCGGRYPSRAAKLVGSAWNLLALDDFRRKGACKEPR